MSENEAAFRIQASYRHHRKDRLRSRQQLSSARQSFVSDYEVDPLECDRYSVGDRFSERFSVDEGDGETLSPKSSPNDHSKMETSGDDKSLLSAPSLKEMNAGWQLWNGVFRRMRDSAEEISSPTRMTSEFAHYRAELELRPTRWPPWVQSWRISLFLLIEEPRSSCAAQVVSVAILFFITIAVSSFILETMPELKEVPSELWYSIEVVCNVVFTIEYVIRLWVCGVIGSTVWKFVTTPMNICDFCAILPFYLDLVFARVAWARALGVIRTVRLVRLFRIFKLGRYSSGLQLMGEALRNSAQALWVLGFFLGIGILLFSSAIYYVEKIGCPDQEALAREAAAQCALGSNCTKLDDYKDQCHSQVSNGMTDYGLCCDDSDTPLDYTSIVEAFWWALVTMTTVGYGDAYPKTELGRVVGTTTMLSGILLIALPVAVIGRKFQEAYEGHLDRQAGRSARDMRYQMGESSLQTVLGQKGSHTQHAPSPAMSYSEMGRRLKLMKVPDAAFGQDANKLAEELEDMANVQKEILALQSFEAAKRAEVLEEFEVILSELVMLSGAKPATKWRRRNTSFL